MSPNWTEWFDHRFQIAFYSSNNPSYFTTKLGYYFCKDAFSTEIVQSEFIDNSLNEICKNKSVFIPQSEAQLNQATRSLRNFAPNSTKFRIFTDYKRINESHFWSETARHWWNLKNESQEGFQSKLYGCVYETYWNGELLLETLWKYLQTYNVGTFVFPGRVVCDGYKKLINTSHEKSCICIGKRVQNLWLAHAPIYVLSILYRT